MDNSNLKNKDVGFNAVYLNDVDNIIQTNIYIHKGMKKSFFFQQNCIISCSRAFLKNVHIFFNIYVPAPTDHYLQILFEFELSIFTFRQIRRSSEHLQLQICIILKIHNIYNCPYCPYLFIWSVTGGTVFKLHSRLPTTSREQKGTKRNS